MKLQLFLLLLPICDFAWGTDSYAEGRKAFNYQMGLRKAKLLNAITGPNDTPFEKAVKELMTQFVIEAEAEIMESSIKNQKSSQKDPEEGEFLRSARQSTEDFEAILEEALKYREQVQASLNESASATTPTGLDTAAVEAEPATDSSGALLPTTTAPPGFLSPSGPVAGVFWEAVDEAVEAAVSVAPHIPSAAVGATGNFAKYLVGLLPLPNVTDVVTTTLQGVRKRPIHTAISGLSNLVFCSPPIAGINYGRCYAWFQTRDNEEYIRLWKLRNPADFDRNTFLGIFD